MKKIIAFVPFLIVSEVFAEDTIPTKHAKENGVKACISAVEKVSNFIADGSHGASSVWNSSVPDESAFSSVIERTYSDGSILTSMTVTPTKSAHCYAEYEKIFYSTDNCIATVQKNFKDAEYKGELNKNIASLKQGAVDIFLMSAGTGCVVVKKEILMNAK